MKKRLKLIIVFFIGILFSLTLISAFVKKHANNDLTFLLTFEDNTELGEYAKKDFGRDLAYTIAHDGQFTYLIARNPFGCGEICKDLGIDIAYRYQRYLFSLIGGGFGQFGPDATLYALVGLQVFFFALGAFALLKIIYYHNYSILLLFFWFTNLGLFYSIVLLTSDLMASSLCLVGLYSYLKEKNKLAIFFFALVGLTKEVYLLVPLSIILYEFFNIKNKTKSSIYILSFIPGIINYIFWRLYYDDPVGSSWKNFTYPFWTIIESLIDMPQKNQQLYSIYFKEYILLLISFIIFLFVIFCYFKSKNLFLKYLAITWIILAIFSSDLIWAVGNQSLRVFNLLYLFLGFFIVDRYKRKS